MRAREFINDSVQIDHFHGSKFADDDGSQWSVEKVLDFAKNNPKYFKKDFPLSKIQHDLDWWEDNPEQRKRMKNADTSYPLLVLQMDDGHLSVADGLNRMKKAISVEKRKTIDVYLVPKKDIMDLADREIDEMALPADWNPAALGHDKSFKSRLEYALQRAPRLGGGSSRVAFVIPDQGRETVLKIAKNRKGMAQNQAEADILDDGYLGKLDIVIPLIDYDKSNREPVWIQTEKANKVSNQKLAKMLHCDKTSWGLTYLVYAVKNILGRRQKYMPDLDKIKQDLLDAGHTEQDLEIFMGYADEVADLVGSSSLLEDDFNNASNWGEYNGRPVVIDLGFTESVHQLYWGKR